MQAHAPIYLFIIYLETDTDQTTRVDLTPARVSGQSVLLSGTK